MSQKRKLTLEEIQDILSIIQPQKKIPIDSAISVMNINRKQIEEQITNQLIYPSMIPKLKLMIEQAYFKSRVQPGECVGVLTAQSIGEKQTQSNLNSIDWHERILYIYKNKTVIEPIGKMIDRLLDDNIDDIKLIPEGKTQYLSIEDGYYIPSGDENGKQYWKKIEAVTKHLPAGKLVKVKTQSGRTVSASQGNSFLVWDGNKFIPTLGSKVKVGDILPTTRNMPEFKNTSDYFIMESVFPKSEYIYSSEIVKARECKQKSKYWWKEHNKIFTTPYKRGDTIFGKRKELFMNIESGYVFLPRGKFVSYIPEKIPLDEEFGFLIGIFLAEGLTTSTFVNISNNSHIIREKVQKWCDRYKITYRVVETKGNQLRKDCIGYSLTIHSVLLARLLTKICSTGSENKYVPLFAYTAPKVFIKGILDGYISGDGTINKKDGFICISSASKELISGISFLLSYFNVFGKLSGVQPKSNNVGSKNILYSYTLQIRNNFAKNFTTQINLTEPNKNKKLKKITLNKDYRHPLGYYMKNYPHNRDVYFDKIVNIEYVEATGGVVYDFTVADTRRFNLFNGLNLMDSFHKAGSAENTKATGTSRFSELLNATKDQKLINCFIYFKSGNDSIKEVRDLIGHSLVELTMKKICKSIDICVNKNNEKWYKAFEIIHGDTFTKYEDCISVKIDMDKIYEYKLTLKEIAIILNNEYEDICCVFSPDNIGQLDIFVDTTDIVLPEDRLIFINKENAKEIYLEEVVQPLVIGVLVAGIKGIDKIYFNKDREIKGKWMIETDGTNFQKLLGHKDIDSTRTFSNHIWDIYKTLGIEAVREYMVQEFMNIMSDINICHVQLLCEKMTHNGTISSVSRYSMRTEDCGPLAKSSFEETVDNLLKAGIYGQNDPTDGVSASIICGKRANIGTGLCTLKMNLKMLKEHRILNPIVEENKTSESDLKMPFDTNPKPKFNYTKQKIVIENEDDVNEDDIKEEENEDDDYFG